MNKSVLEGKKLLSTVVFELMGELFAVDVNAAREIIRLTNISPMPQSPDFIEGVINIRGHVVAVVDLKKRFHISEIERTNKERIMVVLAQRMIVGLIVDAVFGVKKFPNENIQATPAIVSSHVPKRCISGIVYWEDRIIFLLELNEVFNASEAELLKNV